MLTGFISTFKNRGLTYLISLTSLIISTIGLFISLTNKNINTLSNDVSTSTISNTSIPNNVEDSDTIIAYISGAVVKPGIYKLSASDRVHDLVSMSGGFTSTADFSFINNKLNLAEKVSDELHLYIPRTDFIFISTVLPENHIENAPDTSINKEASQNKININTASKEELMGIKGIGESYATKIVNSRPYKNMTDVSTKLRLSKNLLTVLESEVVF